MIPDRTCIYVGHLSSSVGEKDLEIEFERFGQVREVCLIRHPISNASRGFAYITYYDQGSCDRAIKEMNNKSWNGRIIRAEYSTTAKPSQRESRPPSERRRFPQEETHLQDESFSRGRSRRGRDDRPMHMPPIHEPRRFDPVSTRDERSHGYHHREVPYDRYEYESHPRAIRDREYSYGGANPPPFRPEYDDVRGGYSRPDSMVEPTDMPRNASRNLAPRRFDDPRIESRRFQSQAVPSANPRRFDITSNDRELESADVRASQAHNSSRDQYRPPSLEEELPLAAVSSFKPLTPREYTDPKISSYISMDDQNDPTSNYDDRVESSNISSKRREAPINSYQSDQYSTEQYENRHDRPIQSSIELHPPISSGKPELESQHNSRNNALNSYDNSRSYQDKNVKTNFLNPPSAERSYGGSNEYINDMRVSQGQVSPRDTINNNRYHESTSLNVPSYPNQSSESTYRYTPIKDTKPVTNTGFSRTSEVSEMPAPEAKSSSTKTSSGADWYRSVSEALSKINTFSASSTVPATEASPLTGGYNASSESYTEYPKSYQSHSVPQNNSSMKYQMDGSNVGLVKEYHPNTEQYSAQYASSEPYHYQASNAYNISNVPPSYAPPSSHSMMQQEGRDYVPQHNYYDANSHQKRHMYEDRASSMTQQQDFTRRPQIPPNYRDSEPAARRITR